MPGKRILAALVFLPLFYLLVRYLPPAAFTALVAAATVIALDEFYRLVLRNGQQPIRWLGTALGLLLVVGMSWDPARVLPLTLLLGVAGLLVFRMTSSRPLHLALADVSLTLFGVFYVAWLMGHQVLLRALPGGMWWVLFLYLVTWTGDTGAYWVGSTLGRIHPYPRLSPKKTLEGTLGGIAFSVAAALLARWWFLPQIGLGEALGMGVFLGLASLLGDLAESLLKRGAGVKDSSVIIPGHGGMLDRIDSLLFSAPALYYVLVYTGIAQRFH